MGSRAKKRLKNKLGKKVLAGKMTVTEARSRLGREFAQKAAAPSLAKARSASVAAEPDWLAAMRDAAAAVRAARPVTEQDLMDAARPMARPAVTKAAAPRETRRTDPGVLKSMTTGGGPVPVLPPHHWTGIELALLRKSQTDPDPAARENARATLARELGGKVVI